jgi:prepilin-type N-terminal cleavage/methylation domain-containing protein
MRCRRPDQRGFTLPELLIAVTVLGIIMVPLTASIVVGLRTTGDAQQRLVESRGEQLTAAYFPTDVASADTIVPNDANPCGGAGPAVVVSFDWADDHSPTNEVSYVVPAGSSDMYRKACQGGVVHSTNLLASGLSGKPIVTCTPNADCSGTPSGATISVTGQSGTSYTVTGTRRSS